MTPPIDGDDCPSDLPCGVADEKAGERAHIRNFGEVAPGSGGGLTGHPRISMASSALEGSCSGSRQRIVRLAFLAPEIQKAILAGTQPRSMTLASLTQGTMPILWADQLRTIGMT